VEFCEAKFLDLKSAWMLIASGGTDAAVSTALGGVLLRKTPKLKIGMDADFKPLALPFPSNFIY
jgi:hypothetical protein